MDDKRDSVVFYRSFMEALDPLPAEEYKRLAQMILHYAMDGAEPENRNSMDYSMFLLVKPQIDANNERYLNGCKGGAPIGNQNARKQPKTTENNRIQPKNNQKQPNDNDNDNDNDKEKENENVKGKEKENEKENVKYQEIVDLYNTTCTSFPSVRFLSDARRKAIHARLNQYGIDDFRMMFVKAEESDFLKGANKRNWQPSFDWFLKDTNMAKVLDGNYDNYSGSGGGLPGRNDWIDQVEWEETV